MVTSQDNVRRGSILIGLMKLTIWVIGLLLWSTFIAALVSLFNQLFGVSFVVTFGTHGLLMVASAFVAVFVAWLAVMLFMGYIQDWFGRKRKTDDR